MTKVSRNAPCPCGSGRKYKQCCARSEREERAPVRHPLAGAAAAHEWQAEIFPLPIDIEDSPQVRPTSLLVTAGGYVLHSDIQTEPLGEAEEIAAKLAAAVEMAARAVDVFPDAVGVRWADVAAAVQRLLGERTTVRCRAFLDELVEPARALLANVADYPHWPTVSMPDSWLAWGLPAPVIAELFDAAADYHRAAPWRWLGDAPPVQVALPGRRVWTIAVMGSGGREFGLTMFELPTDYLRSLEGDDARAVFAAMEGRAIGLGFTTAAAPAPAVRREVAAHRWRTATPAAYPLLLPINSPAGGIARADAADLIVVLRATAAFAVEHAAAFEAGEPVDATWVHPPTRAVVHYRADPNFGAWDDDDDRDDDADARSDTSLFVRSFLDDACDEIDVYASRDDAATRTVVDSARLLLRQYADAHADEIERALKPEVWAAGALHAAFRFGSDEQRTAKVLAAAFDVSSAAVNARSRKLADAAGWPAAGKSIVPPERTGAPVPPTQIVRPRATDDATLSLFPGHGPADEPASPRQAAPPSSKARRHDDEAHAGRGAVVLPFRRRGSAPEVGFGPAPGVDDIPRFTDVQGQYLTFIHYYTKLHRRPPSEADMQAFFRVSPPAVHNMVKTLEKKRLIARVPGQARTTRVLLPRELLPELE